ncbi:MAG: hypothetical protein QOF92_1207 [Pseudonocardiales bacterium]|nr:hypothetical protein [Pseudonocardiales bacterium]
MAPLTPVLADEDDADVAGVVVVELPDPVVLVDDVPVVGLVPELELAADDCVTPMTRPTVSTADVAAAIDAATVARR